MINKDLIISLVEYYRQTQPHIGGRKLHYLLQSKLTAEHQVGRDAFFELLRDNNLLVRKRRMRAITTNSHHWLHKYPNAIIGITLVRANQLWVSDITYIRIGDHFVYLFLITDAYSKKIVGWSLADSLEAKHAVDALQMALNQLPDKHEPLIHHSDRGIQYCSDKYVQILNKHEITISMTEHGDPRENAIAERVNGILKVEWLYDMQLHSIDEAFQAIKKIVHIYNTERPHLSINMLTPEEAHSQAGELQRLWKAYYKKSEVA